MVAFTRPRSVVLSRWTHLTLVLMLVAAMGALVASPGRTAAQADGVQITVDDGTGVAARAGGSGSLVDPQTSVSSVVTLNASAWSGGFYRGDSQWYGRPWVALYGAQSGYNSATFGISMTAAPSANVQLVLTGLNDETGIKNNINVTINGVSVFTGTSWFNSWDGQGQGQNAAWTTVTLSIPPSFFQAGTNTIGVANLRPSANYNQPPYVLMGAAQVTVPGASASPS